MKSAFDELMIITAGWDFLHLTVDRFDWEDGSRRPFAVLMTGDMDFYGVEEVTTAFDGDIDALIPTILKLVDIDFVRYFAIVEQRDVLPEQWSWSDGEPGRRQLGSSNWLRPVGLSFDQPRFRDCRPVELHRTNARVQELSQGRRLAHD